MTDFKLPGGSTLDVTLKRAPKRRRRRPGDEPDDEGLIPVGDDPTRYVFRGKLSVEVFDLGTRLRSVPEQDFDEKRVRLSSELSAPETRDDNFNEYVEKQFGAAGTVEVSTPGNYIRLNLSDAEVRSLDRQLLGLPGDELDPFGFTAANRSGRKLPNCMPLPHANNFKLDLLLGEERYALAAPDSRSTFAQSDLHLAGDGAQVEEERQAEWKKREPEDGDAAERWNPFNTGARSSSEFINSQWQSFTSLNSAFEPGVLKPKKGAGGRLAVAHGHNEPLSGNNVGFGLFETFDTSDAETFKITREPSFDAEAVDFRLPSARVRVYLRPRIVKYFWGIFGLNNFTRPLGDQVMFAGRLPVYPFLPTGDLRLPSQKTINSYLARTPEAAAAVRRNRALYPGATSNPNPTGLASIYEFPGDGSTFARNYVRYNQVGLLVGVVVAGSRKYYVWRKRQDQERNAGTFPVSTDVPELAGLY